MARKMGKNVHDFDDAQLDTDSTAYTAQDMPMNFDGTKSKSARKTWLMNPATALFGGGSHSVGKKTVARHSNATPGANRGSVSPPGRQQVQRLGSSPTPQPPQGISPGTNSSSSNFTLTASTSHLNLPREELAKGNRRGSDRPPPEAHSDEWRDTKKELRRLADEVIGLQTEINKLREGHASLERDLRANQSLPSGALPVDSVKLGGKQAAKPAGKHVHIAGFPGQEVHTKDLVLDVEGSQKPARQETPPERQISPVPPATGNAPEHDDLLGGFWESCGFASKTPKALPAPPTPKSTSAAAGGSHGVAHQNPASSHSADDALSSAVGAHSHSSHSAVGLHTHFDEVGGSTASARRRQEESAHGSAIHHSAVHSSSASRGNSPHNREPPMESRNNAVGGGRHMASGSTLHPELNFGTSASLSTVPSVVDYAPSPTFSTWPRQHAGEHAPVPSFGAERHHSEDSEAPRFGGPAHNYNEAGAFSQPHLGHQAHLSSAQMDSSHMSSAQKQPPHSWRAAQAGGELVLPFPDHEDEESAATSSPGFSPPAWEASATRHPAVPPLNLT